MRVKITLSNGMVAQTSSQRRFVLFHAGEDRAVIVRRSDDLAKLRKLWKGHNDFIVDTVQGREIR